ncbi:MAG: phospholipase D-like domain-containing protein [Novosphingobium sp.]|nr:phospholipase [Novosphingobium sp.]
MARSTITDPITGDNSREFRENGHRTPEAWSMPAAADAKPILREGETCWQLAHADRVSFIVDAADYFAAAKAAIASARSAVYLIGWDFDLHIRLTPDEDNPAFPDELRRFLAHTVERRPDLRIYILQWDGAMIANIVRQVIPFMLLRIGRGEQLRFRLDSEHPAGACHHQKILVVDDAIAFCGGIDMTKGRWDTRAHRAGDKGRTAPDGTLCEPWHDMTMAVDGQAAKALGNLARDRWQLATGEELPAPERPRPIWPERLPVSCRNTDVAISRTMPAHADRDPANEIEHLWLEAIAAAQRSIYIENQYLASNSITEALIERLKDRDGPEVVIVLPSSSESWLEQEVMDSARANNLARLREADRHSSLGVYYPVNEIGEAIYVHAKLLIVDDRLVRIGSSNMSNRSMRFDSECDLAIEAEAGDAAVMEAITGLRDSLVAEHFGMSQEGFAGQLAIHRHSLVNAIEAIRARIPEPTLRPLPVEELTDGEEALAHSDMLNPEKPAEHKKRASQFLGSLSERISQTWARLGAALGITPLATFLRSLARHSQR